MTAKVFKLTEKIRISRSHEAFEEIDNLSFRCKNLANSVLYHLRGIRFRNKELDIENGETYEKYPSKFSMVKIMEDCEAYKEIGNTKISQNIVSAKWQEFDNFRKAESDYFKNPTKYKGKPKLPRYEDSEYGRSKIILNPQTLSKPYIRKGEIKTSLINHSFKFRLMGDENVKVKQVDIVPSKCKTYYTMYIIYDLVKDVEIPCNEDGEAFSAGIDLGKSILSAVAITSGKGKLISGKPLVHLNNQYNKMIDKAKSKLPKGIYTSKLIKSLHRRRKDKIDDYLHKTSRILIDLLESEHVSNLYIGHNKNWKQNINIGRINNRQFVEIPFNRYIHMLQYKGNMVGMNIKVTEEAYTSKASALDKDQLFSFKEREKANNYKFSGKRVKRGLYKTKNNVLCNADSNGAFNIIRKCDSTVENLTDYHSVVIGCVVHPEYVKIDV